MMQNIFVFLIYSVMGWLLEVVYHLVTLGGFVNRGFLKGPYCPIYGFGMILIVDLLHPYVNNPLSLFVASIVVTTLLELVVGFALEFFLKKRWWDYSDEPLNFRGYICARFSLYWGIGALIAVKFIHPCVLWIYHIMPEILIDVIIVIVGTMMIIDALGTLTSLLSLNRQLVRLNALNKRIEELSLDIGGKIEKDGKKIQDVIDEYKKQLDEEKFKLANKHRRLFKAFPNVREKDVSTSQLLSELKERAASKQK